MRKYRLLIDVPFLRKGSIFYFNDDLGWVHGDENGQPMKYALREGLAGYLWLLMTEDGYMEKLND